MTATPSPAMNARRFVRPSIRFPPRDDAMIPRARWRVRSGAARPGGACCRASSAGRVGAWGSLDDLVGAREQHGWNGDTDRLGSDQIYNEIELSRLLDWNISRFRPTQNFVDIVGGVAVQVGIVWSIRHQPTRFDIFALRVHSRKPCGEREGVDPHAVQIHQGVADDIERLDAILERLQRWCDLFRASRF